MAGEGTAAIAQKGGRQVNLSERLSKAQQPAKAPAPEAAVPEKPEPTPRTAASERPDARPIESRMPQQTAAPRQQPVDALAGLKQRAATALFERMGARFSDSSATEQELRTAAREELTQVIDA